MKYLPRKELKEWRDKNTPKVCPIFGIEMNDAVVDHDHETGMVRGVLHRQANAWEGKVFNAWKRFGGNNAKTSYPSALRALADYIEFSRTLYLHPVGLKQLSKRFSRLKKEEQIFSLKALGALKKSEIEACKNTQQRVKLFETSLKNLWKRKTSKKNTI